jgi:diguanylate cyclase (GGDEF)-like protein
MSVPRPASPRFTPLGTKLAVTTVVVVAMGIIVSYFETTGRTWRNLLAAKQTTAAMVTELFCGAVGAAVEFGDEEGMKAQLSYLRSNKDVVSASVWKQGERNSLVAFGPVLVAPARPTSATTTVSTGSDTVRVDCRLSRPDGPGIGIASVAFALKPELDAYNSGRNSILLFGVFLAGGIAGLLILFSRWMIVRPIARLTAAARRMEQGIPTIVSVHANDEIGTLAHAFNAMSEAIRDREVKLAAVNRELEELSLTDPLTGLRNRRFFKSIANGDASLFRRTNVGSKSGPPPSRNRDMVMYVVDLDFFKQVNDTFGHAAGDFVLKETAARLRRATRASDILVRWGGEEFLVVARNSERTEATVLAQRILDFIANEPFRLPDGRLVQCSCSVGFASYPWDTKHPDNVTVDQVVEMADRGLYVAKTNGRNGAVGCSALGSDEPSEDWFDQPVEKVAGIHLDLIHVAGPEGKRASVAVMPK